MAYATGAAASISALHDAVIAFAVANGWTLTRDSTASIAFPSSNGTNVSNATNVSIAAKVHFDPASAYSLNGTTTPQTIEHSVLTKGTDNFSMFAGTRRWIKNGVLGDYPFLELWHAPGTYSAGATPWTQANNRKLGGIGPLTGSFANYFLFSDASGSYIHLVVEESGGGSFRHFGFGTSIRKYGTWTGGQYGSFSSGEQRAASGATPQVDATRQKWSAPFAGWSGIDSVDFLANNFSENATQVRVDTDGIANHWRIMRTSQYTSNASGTKNEALGTFTQLITSAGYDGGFYTGSTAGNENAFFCCLPYSHGVQPWNSRAMMTPCYLMASQVPASTSGNFRLLGEFPDVRYMSIALNNPGEEITYAGETWKVFPILVKGVSTTQTYTRNHAIAYKKIE